VSTPPSAMAAVRSAATFTLPALAPVLR